MTLLEPTIGDFINAASQLDRETFCQKFPWPLLIASGLSEDALQTDPTEVFKPDPGEMGRAPSFKKNDPVLMVMSEKSPESGVVTVGRSEENDIVVRHESLSGKHAVFRRIDASLYMVEDLSSTNGILINAEMLDPGQKVKLKDGDVLYLGNVKFKFFYPAAIYDLLARVKSESMQE